MEWHLNWVRYMWKIIIAIEVILALMLGEVYLLLRETRKETKENTKIVQHNDSILKGRTILFNKLAKEDSVDTILKLLRNDIRELRSPAR